jgi:hypothetical protein
MAILPTTLLGFFQPSVSAYLLRLLQILLPSMTLNNLMTKQLLCSAQADCKIAQASQKGPRTASGEDLGF